MVLKWFYFNKQDLETMKHCFYFFFPLTMCTWCVHIESWGRFVTTSALREKCPYLELFWSAFFFASLRIQSKCEKIRTKITPNKDSFYAVLVHPEISKETVFDEVTLCNAGWLFLSCRMAKAIILSITIKKAYS